MVVEIIKDKDGVSFQLQDLEDDSLSWHWLPWDAFSKYCDLEFCPYDLYNEKDENIIGLLENEINPKDEVFYETHWE